MELLIQLFLGFLGTYTAIGVLFALYFFFKGAFKIDPLIGESKWTVRLLLVPGAIGLWPLLLSKIMNKSRAAS